MHNEQSPLYTGGKGEAAGKFVRVLKGTVFIHLDWRRSSGIVSEIYKFNYSEDYNKYIEKKN